MKIGIDARLYLETGVGRYIRNLIRELEKVDSTNEYVIFLNKKSDSAYHPENPRFKKWITNAPWYSLGEQTSLISEYMRARLDLLHVPHFNVPILYPRKIVMTLHDLTMGEYSDAQATGKSPLVSFAKRYGYKAVINAGIIKSKAIFVPSNSVSDGIKKSYPVARKKNIFVTYEGVEEKLMDYIPTDAGALRTRLEEMTIKGPYLLYVGSAYSHKNLESLIVSFKELITKHGAKIQLVLACKIDLFSQRLAALVHGLGLDGHIVFAAKYAENGYITDKDLAWLYKGAYAFVHPSLSEGFSITPLEAQAFGTPIVISDIPVHKEIFKESALYFNPASNIDIENVLEKIILDDKLRQEFAEKALVNVKSFSWSKMAKETLDVYNTA